MNYAGGISGKQRVHNSSICFNIYVGGMVVSNQVILWGGLIVPWLTLFFMPKEDIKRYIAVGFLATILCIVVIETGISYAWWTIRETTYPFVVIPTYTYGLFPVVSMWLFKYTYGRFGLYLAVDTVLNIVFAFAVLPWLGSRGILDFDAGLIAFIFVSVISIIMYGFQIWQEGVFARSERSCTSPNLQPAAAKPLDQNGEDNDKKQ